MQSRTPFVVRDQSHVAIISPDSNISIDMWRTIWMNNYDIAVGKDMGTSNNITVGQIW